MSYEEEWYEDDDMSDAAVEWRERQEELEQEEREKEWNNQIEWASRDLFKDLPESLRAMANMMKEQKGYSLDEDGMFQESVIEIFKSEGYEGDALQIQGLISIKTYNETKSNFESFVYNEIDSYEHIESFIEEFKFGIENNVKFNKDGSYEFEQGDLSQGISNLLEKVLEDLNENKLLTSNLEKQEELLDLLKNESIVEDEIGKFLNSDEITYKIQENISEKSCFNYLDSRIGFHDSYDFESYEEFSETVKSFIGETIEENYASLSEGIVQTIKEDFDVQSVLNVDLQLPEGHKDELKTSLNIKP